MKDAVIEKIRIRFRARLINQQFFVFAFCLCYTDFKVITERIDIDVS